MKLRQRQRFLWWLRRLSRIPVYRSWQPWAMLGWLLHWLLLAMLIGGMTGIASAVFLISLDWVTHFRDQHSWIILGLPLAGLFIGWLYYKYGREANEGQNALLKQYYQPTKVLPLRMAPLVLLGTLVTHLFGGSAGREGTAVQMGGALADQCTHWLAIRRRDRKLLLVMGISGGFASVFGTPLAGAVFALEVMVLGRMRYDALLPSFMAAAWADWVCRACGAPHTHYPILATPDGGALTLAWVMVVGILCGLVANLFIATSHGVVLFVSRIVAYPPCRPVLGGTIVIVLVGLLGTTKYIGLGIPVIESAFEQPIEPYAFAIKILLTALTLGSGFKGGEVTPLFFIGATLGNALVWVIPLPLELLVGLGFVAVFAAATNTPLACTLMGLELFGHQAGLHLGLACVTAYMFSGHRGIYTEQVIGSPKHSDRRQGRFRSLPARRDSQPQSETTTPTAPPSQES